ncbi:MAG: hypothetical protein CMI26_04445 [Opitutae bacterium]|nr:hypothetical protein [Opitutae bacterium]
MAIVFSLGTLPPDTKKNLGILDRESQVIVEVESHQLAHISDSTHLPSSVKSGLSNNTFEKCQAKTEEVIPLICLSKALSARLGEWPTPTPFSFSLCLCDRPSLG